MGIYRTVMLTTLMVHGVPHCSLLQSVTSRTARRTNIGGAAVCSTLINVEALRPSRAQAQNSAPGIQRHAQATANCGDRTSQDTQHDHGTAHSVILITLLTFTFMKWEAQRLPLLYCFHMFGWNDKVKRLESDTDGTDYTDTSLQNSLFFR